MIRRFYVHNYRCLENFDLPVNGLSSVLIIGKNGSGKTTVSCALEILQKIARGANRVSELLNESDFSQGRSSVPMSFELELEINSKVFAYSLSLELPVRFKELRVREEKLTENGKIVFDRKLSEVSLPHGPTFNIDWHLVGLTIVQDGFAGPITAFTSALRRILILRPIPQLIRGSSKSRESAEPDDHVTNLGAWFTEISVSAPSIYSVVDSYLKKAMPDFDSISNPSDGKDSRILEINFANESGRLTLEFGALSNGEKIFFITAMVLAAKKVDPKLICFWDEPDNHIVLSEISLQIVDLRRAFESQGQLIVTSHSEEAIRKFPRSKMLYMYRKSHLEPSQIRLVGSMEGITDLIGTLIEGDLAE